MYICYRSKFEKERFAKGSATYEWPFGAQAINIPISGPLISKKILRNAISLGQA